MRVSRLTGVLAGVLIALLATGSLRLAHMAMAHASGSEACASVCAHAPSGTAPADHESPSDPALPRPGDCSTCALLAVLLPDGMPVAPAPFFPACAGAVIPDRPESAPVMRVIGVALARGPPTIAPLS